MTIKEIDPSNPVHQFVAVDVKLEAIDRTLGKIAGRLDFFVHLAEILLPAESAAAAKMLLAEKVDEMAAHLLGDALDGLDLDGEGSPSGTQPSTPIRRRTTTNDELDGLADYNN